jgi:hypothetical protein
MYYGENEVVTKTYTSSLSHRIVVPVEAMHGEIMIHDLCSEMC